MVIDQSPRIQLHRPIWRFKMMVRSTVFLYVLAAIASVSLALPVSVDAADRLTNEQREFFETRIRPVLVEQCYACHNSTKQADGELVLDHRAGLLKGGEKGAIVVPGKPRESRLIAILKHEVPGLKMPQGGAKLEARVVADFEKWIESGAPDPREQPPSAEEIAKVTSWEAVLVRRKQWWSLQPIRSIEPPVVENKSWSSHPVDRFVLAKLREHQLNPSPRADARTLVRRAFLVLIGLPPTVAESEQWSARLKEERGFDALIDHLLASPHFGERWARHWMDWIRYCDSHGSEGDPAIENGWMYRDYLIRALNADVSYDQLVREHLAGDLLPKPRLNPELGLNESVIGTAHWRMVFHGFAPTDALDEKVRFIDDQINAFSKAFLGLTVSCARCHDHKFDAISQQDYYALFGVLSACRPGRLAIDEPQRLTMHRDKLVELKSKLRTALAEEWLKRVPSPDDWLKGTESRFKDPKHPLHVWQVLRDELASGKKFEDAWQQRVTAWQNERRLRSEQAQRAALQRWSMSKPEDAASWTRTGNGLEGEPVSRAGEFAIAPAGDQWLMGVYPSGIYSHRLSTKHAARLTSRDFKLDGEYNLFLRTIGAGSNARYVIHDYPRNGTVYPVAGLKSEWQWQRLDLGYWDGDSVHLEVATAADAPLMARNEPRSWFGVRDVLVVKKNEPAPTEFNECLDSWFELAAIRNPKSINEAAELLTTSLRQAVTNWSTDKASDAEALLVDACLKHDLLPNSAKGQLVGSITPLVAEYRRLEAELPVPTRVPSLEEAADRTQPLYERGNHKLPKETVPRRFLEALNGTPYPTTTSGRLQLADDVLRANNPLTRRVIVNRLWHHLFGRGIVATPDNFGRLGHAPTHPELLDHLATQFAAQGGSIKQMVRYLVTSESWRLSSHAEPAAQQRDPDNQWWSHAMVRRLEAEAIRDSLLAVSGQLNRDLYGAPVDGGSVRRSVYVRVQRNALDPFLRAFDFPEPFTAVGRRDVTNVPAQSLTLMNDERVGALATAWATRALSESGSDATRTQSMFMAALGRPAETTEVVKFQTYLADAAAQQTEVAQRMALLRRQIQERQTSLQNIVGPVRTKLLAAAKEKTDKGEAVVPQPIGKWEFESDPKDSIGSAHGELRDGAKLDNGAVLVNGQGFVSTAPINKTLKAKTLEAWVQLDNLDQKGGGVMTVQTRDGVLFDSIVFGEQQARHWMAGSNFFARTQSFQGLAEADANQRAVHVAIAYHADGKIVGYRDGQPYGKPYQSNGPHEFKAGETVVSFGVRHLPAGGNRMLSGRILRAQLYDRALASDEVAATSQSAPYFVSEAQILAALTETQREQVTAEKQRIVQLEKELAELGPTNQAIDEKATWTDLARALFTFKEFVFVK